MISRVILAWRTRFMSSVNLSITSLAFFEAESMAVIRDAQLRSHRFQQRVIDLVLDQLRQQLAEDLFRRLLVEIINQRLGLRAFGDFDMADGQQLLHDRAL